MHHMFSLFAVKIENLNKIITPKSYRYIHKTIPLRVRTNIQVNEYLLNRSVPAIEILNNLTPEDAIRLSEIKNQYNLQLTKGELVPKVLKDIDLVELLCLSCHQRVKYLIYLAKIEFAQANRRAKVLKNAAKEKFFIENTNTFFGKYFNKKLSDLEIQRAFQSIVLNNQKIVFDFSFENDMNRREIKGTVKQVLECYGFNRKLSEPYQLGIVNLQPGSIGFSDLNNMFLSHKSNRFEILENTSFRIDQRPLTEVYSRKELIYLSPNSSNIFEEGEYDHDATFVIGGLVDLSEQLPLTLAKARKEGLKHRSLPLDRHINWVKGNKSLPLRQVFEILSIARETNGNWRSALRHSLPPRIVTPIGHRASHCY